MMDSWTCLMVENGPGMIDDEVRRALKMAACELHLQKKDRTRIHEDVCDGIVSTQWSIHVVGGLSGVLFRAVISHETGDYKINFLLNTDDLERGAEFLKEITESDSLGYTDVASPFPCQELYLFDNLRKRNKRLH